VVQRLPHHFLHRLWWNFLPACHIRRHKGQGKQLIVCHRIIIADVIRLLYQFPVDLLALFHDLQNIRFAVFLCKNLFHRALKHPEIEAIIFHCPVLHAV